MFGLGKKSKEEPDRPAKIELGVGRPAPGEYQPRWSAPLVGGMPHLARHLPALSSSNRPGLPPADLATKYDVELGDLITAVHIAESAALQAAQGWLSATQGDGLKDALAADTEWVLPWIEKGEPAPVDTGPLYRHMTSGLAEAFAEAHHAQVRVDFLDRRVRQHGSTRAVREMLVKENTRLIAEITALLEQARDEKNSRIYDRALDVCREWAEASSILEWAENTTAAFRGRNPNSYPRHLGILNYEVETALGRNPIMVPLESLEDPDAPDSVLFPRERPPMQVFGDDVHWGPDGPPGYRQAPGVS